MEFGSSFNFWFLASNNFWSNYDGALTAKTLVVTRSGSTWCSEVVALNTWLIAITLCQVTFVVIVVVVVVVVVVKCPSWEVVKDQPVISTLSK